MDELYIYFDTSIVEGPAFRLCWYIKLELQENALWQQFGAGYLTNPTYTNDNTQLISTAEPLCPFDQLDAVIDPERGISRVFHDVRAARDYENLVKKHVPGLTQYWQQAQGYAERTHWFPRRPPQK